MKRGRAWGLWAGAILAAFACAVACGSETTSIPGAESSDAGAEGAVSNVDGPVESSSGSDGATPGDGASGPFCASLTPAPTVCEDFDDGTPPQDSDTQLDPGASVGIDGTFSTSPPKSYRAQVAAPQGVTNALLRTPLAGPKSPKTFLIAFNLRISAAPPPQGTLVVARAFLSQTHSVAVELTSENGPVLREQENALDRPSAKMTSLPAANAWSRLELAIDIAGKSATLKTNGVTVAKLALTGSTYDFQAVNLGLQSDKAFTAWFDDVVFDLH